MDQRVDDKPKGLVIVHRPCAFNDRVGATAEFCSRMSKVPRHNLGGCTKTQCESPLRFCRVCVASGAQDPALVAPQNWVRGLCEFHLKHGEDARQRWLPYEERAVLALPKTLKRSDEPENGSEPPDKDEPVPLEKKKIRSPKRRNSSSTSNKTLAKVPQTMESRQSMKPQDDDPDAIKRLNPDVQAFFSRHLPESERLPREALDIIAKFPFDEQVGAAMRMRSGEKVEPSVQVIEEIPTSAPSAEIATPTEPAAEPANEAPVVAEPAVETASTAPEVRVDEPVIQVDPLASLKTQLAPRVRQLLEAGTIDERVARKLAKYGNSLQLGKARDYLAGRIKASQL
jgi:hypothetical protein